ncbi:ImmA/IrrE family metallo-endopeptidase [Clostridium celatum]|uniref:ImmA/IrrE family metallo-endopeptidase n=1 Tax=Clostridium celatum TaxID=36834 RepID=UPI00290864B4|nr:ImmA/IrrE family metallo-endopeptidase [Clostridium celatum]MDU6297218.1 ImmA/IrrE family metallo-endopeptidase [Clostridium celatum]
MKYEKLMIKYENNVKIKEKSLKYGFKGLYKNNKIIIDSNIETNSEKACILAEELGHHFTTYGNIIDQSDIKNIKQELRARAWAYERLVGIVNLINAYKAGVKGRYELAEFLGVTEEFLLEAIEYYRNKYGTCYKIDNYIIYFSPTFGIMEFF